MRAISETPLLDANALKQPLAYEREVDAALFLGGSDREQTETELTATAYYLQHRTAQLTGNVALTGTQVAEKVDEMIEDVKNPSFVRLLVNDYRTATEPRDTLAEMWNFYKPDMSRQPRIGKILKQAVIFSPMAFIIDFEGVGNLLSQPTAQRIGGTIFGGLLAGYVRSWHQKHYETHQLENLAGSPINPSELLTT